MDNAEFERLVDELRDAAWNAGCDGVSRGDAEDAARAALLDYVAREQTAVHGLVEAAKAVTEASEFIDGMGVLQIEDPFIVTRLVDALAALEADHPRRAGKTTLERKDNRMA